ncbi:helix-turn-helix domain-containing protein [Cronobacter sakazakii]|uniref:helix-turn-helix domain-containing protein n=1 Tax=Cronobacter sakazakii TaxID=28141 RepID=UPI000978B00F|nr:helix-turn-helix domain-containing protein [Cronobacter sakazakii]EKK4080316.1 helix-turn-helix domain-containing protein [Cronobacter dublinensis]ELY4662220.1 helix-turn-helix domain-containing protein [Cronobacter muytjensii]ELZ9929959.1 helix-turn-helix domain-containing protein [Cronobacter malonaticus]EJH8725053.1 helix-turn-helix domain-containing protein [Cronobacter sakazakii]EJJ0563758.1 helix-turn-helix domain-containing protein [Cronobacter sakazakii]
MTSETLGRRVLRRRKDVRLTQRDLAKALGISHATISLWESDNTEPSGKNLFALAKVLQCSPTWLLFGDEDKEPGEPLALTAEPSLSPDEQEMLDLYRALPESEQLAQVQNLRARVKNFNKLFDELLKARKRIEKK